MPSILTDFLAISEFSIKLNAIQWMGAEYFYCLSDFPLSREVALLTCYKVFYQMCNIFA
jgi:hypothetical protein